MATSGSALSRQIALDHILRRLIQQHPRQPASVQLWNSITRLIPGVTVQHVSKLTRRVGGAWIGCSSAPTTSCSLYKVPE